MHEDRRDCLQGIPGVSSGIVGRARVSDFDWWGGRNAEKAPAGTWFTS